MNILEHFYTLYQMISVIHTVQTHIETLLLAFHGPVLGEAFYLLLVPGHAEGQVVPRLVILHPVDKYSHEVADPGKIGFNI